MIQLWKRDRLSAVSIQDQRKTCQPVRVILAPLQWANELHLLSISSIVFTRTNPSPGCITIAEEIFVRHPKFIAFSSSSTAFMKSGILSQRVAISVWDCVLLAPNFTRMCSRLCKIKDRSPITALALLEPSSRRGLPVCSCSGLETS